MSNDNSEKFKERFQVDARFRNMSRYVLTLFWIMSYPLMLVFWIFESLIEFHKVFWEGLKFMWQLDDTEPTKFDSGEN